MLIMGHRRVHWMTQHFLNQFQTNLRWRQDVPICTADFIVSQSSAQRSKEASRTRSALVCTITRFCADQCLFSRILQGALDDSKQMSRDWWFVISKQLALTQQFQESHPTISKSHPIIWERNGELWEICTVLLVINISLGLHKQSWAGIESVF